MNITFLLPQPPSAPSGGVKVVYQYANGLAAQGHNINLVHPATLFFIDDEWTFPERSSAFLRACARATAQRFGLDNRSVNWIERKPGVRAIYTPTLAARYIPKSDVIIATLWRTAEYLAKYPTRLGAKYYFIQHYEDWSGPQKRVDRTWRSIERKIVIAEWLLNKSIELNAGPATICQNGIDPTEFYITNAINQRSPFKISMMYSPNKWKGSDIGLDAIEAIKKQIPELQVRLFSASKRPKSIPAWIEFHENPTRDFIRDEIYNWAAIFLCPSISEGWGLPALEAMTCGCALVAADNGGVRDFTTPGRDSEIVEPGTSHPIFEKSMELIYNNSRRIEIATAARDSAKRFTLQKSIDRFSKALK